jgi:acetyltransferase-like isoleucine patch superfamily enzyme
MTQVTAGVIVCGRASVGKKCWIAPNATIERGVRIGDGAVVGMGAVVRKDVLPGTVVAGVPAKELRKSSR